jgi:hypothetical protein
MFIGFAEGRTKEWLKGGQTAVRSHTLILSPQPSTKPGQVQLSQESCGSGKIKMALSCGGV